MTPFLFEVSIRNRVVKGKGSKFERIKGSQGGWYSETLAILAESEVQARQIAGEVLAKRHILGIPRHTKRHIERQFEILSIRRRA